MYPCEATSISGFLQQLAVSYLTRGYWFYVPGIVPETKDPRHVDRKLIDRYGVDISKWTRARRKRAGMANVQYLRHGRSFLLLATKGTHRFFEDEAGQIQDARRIPIRFAGYSVSCKKSSQGRWHAHVRIERATFKNLKAYLEDIATKAPAKILEREFLSLRFEPYAPVRKQLLEIHRSVNRLRRQAGLESLSSESVPWRRRIVRPFKPCEWRPLAEAA